MARIHLPQRSFDQFVDEIVGLHAETLAPGDFDVRPSLVLLRQLDPQSSTQVRGDSATIS